MATLLKGAEVSKAINLRSTQTIQELKANGKNVTLAIVRVGENESDISYENTATKRCDKLGILVNKVVLPSDVSEERFFSVLTNLNEDVTVDGILMFRPLPKHINEEKARNLISIKKDVDCCKDESLSSLFTGKNDSFAPCTAQAVMETLDYYNIDLKGKNVCIVGRSLVVGKPLAMMMLEKNATVTIAHSKTENLKQITSKADIVVTAIGKSELFNKEYFSENQVVIDVGINFNETKGKLTGDVDFESVEPIVGMITPVPGGIGSVTTSVLLSHVILSAKGK